MKRFFTLFTTVIVFLSAHAQEHVYYLLPNSRIWNCEEVTDVNDNLKIDKYANQLKWEEFEWTTGNNDYSPERRAYTWFRGTYCDGIPDSYFNVRHVITFEDLLDGRLEANGNLFPNVRVLWVNVDRKMTKTEFDALFPSDIYTKLANFVKAGGNLYLSTFASRLVWLMGRINAEPGFDENNDIAPGNENWYVRAHFDSQDNHEHAVYKYMSGYNSTSGNFPMLSGINHTNRNCLWEGDYSAFQTSHTCKVLGSWGHDDDKEFKSDGLVEFYPTGDWKGTIICNGLAACSFAPTNGQIANVQNLTKGILDYLSTPVSLSISVKENPVIKDEEYIGVTKSDNLTIISYASTNSDIADIHDVGVGDAGKIFYNYFGDVTFTVTAEGDGIHIPKNIVSASDTCTVTGGDPATYGYVLTYSLHTLDGENLKPDYTAAKWFYDNYVSQGTGCFINPKDYSSSVDIPSAIKVLWVHSDKWNLASDDYYTALGGNNFRDALKNYIIAGGNAFLSKQATRLIGDIGRAKFYPCYEFAGSEYSGGASDTWYMTDDFKWVGTGVSRHWHRAFRFMTGYSTTDNNISHWPLVSAESSYNRTDHWYLWGKSRNGSHEEMETWNDYGCESDCDYNERGRLTNFESKQKCTILGGWGHTANLDAVGMAEFYPATVSETDFKGSVITMGLGAYQWTTDNTCANMANLTKGVLEYLTDVPFVIHHNGDSEGDPREVNNYKETYAGGTIGTTIEYRMKVNALDQWYSLYLPFTVDSVQVWDGGDNTYYDLVPYYRTGEKYYTGHYIIRTLERTKDLDLANFGNWNDPTTSAWLPTGSTPYIIQWHDSYFTNKYISFFGHSDSDIPTSMTAGTAPSTNNVVNICGNDAMKNGSVAGAYLLEGDYGTWGAWLRAENPSEERTILPFECYILASEATRARYRVLRRGMSIEETATGWEDVINSERKTCVEVYTITGYRLTQYNDCSFSETAQRLNAEYGAGMYILRAGNESVKLMLEEGK